MTAATSFKLSQLRPYRALSIAAGGIVILAILGGIFRSQIHNQLNAWKLLPRPERLTELYFTKPNNLPSTYSPGQTQTVSFTVHNLEYRTTTYSYTILEQNNAGTTIQTLSSGSFTLDQNQYQTPQIKVQIADAGTRAKIVVQLTNVHESIDYWLNRSGV